MLLLLLMIVFLLLFFIIIDYLLLMIIIDDYLLLLMIVLLLLMIICYFNKTNFSSSINEFIRSVLFSFIFYDKISQLQKSTKKHQKALKSIFIKSFFVNKQISYFFPIRCFLRIYLINLMLINFKLITFMWMNFVNKQRSYFFPPRCFQCL